MLQATTLIDRSIEDVTHFIYDYQNDWKWRSWYLEVQTLDRENKGKSFLSHAPHPLFASKKPGKCRILSHIPSRQLVSRIELEKITLIDERQVTSQSKNSTEFEYTLYIQLNGLTRLLQPMFFKELQRDFQKDLEWLKELLETLQPEKSHYTETPEALR